MVGTGHLQKVVKTYRQFISGIAVEKSGQLKLIQLEHCNPSACICELVSQCMFGISQSVEKAHLLLESLVINGGLGVQARKVNLSSFRTLL